MSGLFAFRHDYQRADSRCAVLVLLNARPAARERHYLAIFLAWVAAIFCAAARLCKSSVRLIIWRCWLDGVPAGLIARHVPHLRLKPPAAAGAKRQFLRAHQNFSCWIHAPLPGAFEAALRWTAGCSIPDFTMTRFAGSSSHLACAGDGQ